MALGRDDVAALERLCPGVAPEFIREHLERLGPAYREAFGLEEIAEHVRGLARLSPTHAAEVLVAPGEGHGAITCTVLSFDHPSVFSLITGIFASMGFNVESGAAFTYARAPARERRGVAPRPSGAAGLAQTWRGGRGGGGGPAGRRLIVDHFRGRVAAGDFTTWAEELRARVSGVLTELEVDELRGGERARRRVNEWVTRWLARWLADREPALYPVSITVDDDAGPFTRLRVVSYDTPAFLYSFSTALTLQGLFIEQVRVATSEGRVADEFDLVDAAGLPVRDPAARERLCLTARLTKQAAYYLSQAPDPFAALSRFRLLVDHAWASPDRAAWLALLQDPHALRDLAHLLGASDFLWEEFLRKQRDLGLALFCRGLDVGRLRALLDGAERRLEEALRGVAGFEERRRRVNAFKDRQAFLIDLEHLFDGGDLRRLAARLTTLAEWIVRTAAHEVAARLTAEHGLPLDERGRVAPYAVCGLGKLGASALGYASDVELLLVYAGEGGRTAGPRAVENGRYFADLVLGLRDYIEAKPGGLFQVDLALRPHGKDGPLACSLATFRWHYGPGGPAHSLEHLALTRLRAVAGDRALGAEVERLRDQFIYEAPCLKLDELSDTRRRQQRQMLQRGQANAKYSPGGLVDVEYAVQILQVLYGKREETLRTPSIDGALAALLQAEVLNCDEHEDLTGGCALLSRVINGLRMLRGSAEDLVLPAPDSLEMLHLARRVGYQEQGELDPGARLYSELQARMAAVRAFVRHRFGPAGLPAMDSATVADLVLADGLSPAVRRRVLDQVGFHDPQRAYRDLRHLAGEDSQRRLFAQLAVLAYPLLKRQADPGRALALWHHLVDDADDPEPHYRRLLLHPPLLARLLSALAQASSLASVPGALLQEVGLKPPVTA